MTQNAKPGIKSKIDRSDQLSFSPGTHGSHTKPVDHGGFPIVGIRASAGGLEVRELFPANAPADSGMAFCIIQRLHPTHQGILIELLQSYSSKQVIQVRGLMRIRKNSDLWRGNFCDGKISSPNGIKNGGRE